MNEEEQRHINYAIERLDEWGRWQRAMKGDHLSYSLSGLCEHGNGEPALAGEPDGERAKEVEQIMCRIRDNRPTLYRALYAWYVAKQSLVECAGFCRCSMQQYRNLRKMGEEVVYGALVLIG